MSEYFTIQESERFDHIKLSEISEFREGHDGSTIIMKNGRKYVIKDDSTINELKNLLSLTNEKPTPSQKKIKF